MDDFNFTELDMFYIRNAESICSRFKFNREPINPLSLERIYLSVYLQIYSKYLKRDITTVMDSCQHAIEVARLLEAKHHKSIGYKDKEILRQLDDDKTQWNHASNADVTEAWLKYQAAVAEHKLKIKEWELFNFQRKHYISNVRSKWLRSITNAK